MKIFKKILRILLLVFYIIISLYLAIITVALFKCYNGFKPDLIIIGLFGLATIGSVVAIPEWFRENFWYCKHCGRFTWLISKHETIRYDTITHKLCEKCHNEVHTLDYYA